MTYSQITKPKRNREETPKKNMINPGTSTSQVAQGNSDLEYSTDKEPQKRTDDITKSLQGRLDAIQAQFDEKFGRIEGTDMEFTKNLIEE